MSRPAKWPKQWDGKQWRVGQNEPRATITEADVFAVWDALGLNDYASRIIKHFNAPDFSDRRIDRSLQTLRKAGLAEFDKKHRCWVQLGGAS